jgi:hypothetical protein
MIRKILIGALAALLLAPATASAFKLGDGRMPGVAVDTAGTAYIAWIGPGDPAALRFCRLPRGATACVGGGSTIAAPGTTVGRPPFVTVSGNRVVVIVYRHGAGVPDTRALYRFTSVNGGATFGAGVVVGRIPAFEGVAGPGDTFSAVTSAFSEGTVFQNVFLNGPSPVDLEGNSLVGSANLSRADQRPYDGAVGLIGGTTPVVIAASGAGDYGVSRWVGGPLNSSGSWTGMAGVGSYAAGAKLASGRAGLFMLAMTPTAPDYQLLVRKWAGSAFGPPVGVGINGSPGTLHAFQDAGGHLHAAFARGDAVGLHVMHAVSADGGATWRHGIVTSHTTAADGGIGDTRIATAPDHIGVVAWSAGIGAGEVRVASVGPGAPGGVTSPPPPPPPPPPPGPAAREKPAFFSQGAVRRRGKRFRFRVTGRLVVNASSACGGRITLTLRRGKKLVARRTTTVNRRCRFSFTGTIKRSKVKKVKRMKARLAYAGNSALAPVARTGSIPVRR